MLRIKKGTTPKDLADFEKSINNRKKTAADYTTFYNQHLVDRGKTKQPFALLQTSLLKEQHSLCCYCMRKIDDKNITVEHFVEKSGKDGDGNMAIQYSNLLGSCNSKTSCNLGRGQTGKFEHLPNPSSCDLNIEDIIGYSSKGEIIVKPTYQEQISQEQLLGLLKDINERLRLNNETLVNARISYFIRADNATRDSLRRKNDTVKKEDILCEFKKNRSYPFYGYIKTRLENLCSTKIK